MTKKDSRLPLDKFEESLKTEFDPQLLSTPQKVCYDDIVQNRSKLVENPYDLVEKAFSKLSPTRNDDAGLYNEKLKSLDDELDNCVAAKLAKLLFEEYQVRQNKSALCRTINDDGNTGFLKKLTHEIYDTESRVFMDDAYQTTEERQKLTQIVKETCRLLKQMGYPDDELFKSLQKLESHRSLAQQFQTVAEKHSGEKVKVAGINFVMDSNAKRVYPCDPFQLGSSNPRRKLSKRKFTSF